MYFWVRHHTWYHYDVPVRLAPHLVRLTPRPDQGFLHAHQIRVTPTPRGRWVQDDADGNRVLQVAFFDGSARELRVESEFELEVTALPMLPAFGLPALPWWLPMTAPIDSSVQQFAATLASEVGFDALAFLDRLATTLHQRIYYEVRLSGDARPAAWTLANGRGACRDLAVLFLEAAASLGIDGRFVSGYQAESEPGVRQRFLHAWPEVFLPGIGFRGWDPTHGRRVSDEHVALCAARYQTATMPIEGGYTYDGPSLTATLGFSVDIEARR